MRRQPDPKSLVSAAAALTRLGVSRRTLYRWGQLGLVTVYKVGSRNRYDIAELDAMVVRAVRREASC